MAARSFIDRTRWGLNVVIGATRPGRAGLPVAEWFATRARKHARFDFRVAEREGTVRYWMSKLTGNRARTPFDEEALKTGVASTRHPLSRALLVLTVATGLIDAVSYL